MGLGVAMLVVVLVGCGGQTEEQETTTSAAPGATSGETTISEAPTTTEAATPPEDAIGVSISGFAFNPNPVTIESGQTVLWVNNEAVSHTTTSDDDLWNSGSLRTDAQFFFTFEQPGEFAYFCSIHREMTGTVIVE